MVRIFLAHHVTSLGRYIAVGLMDYTVRIYFADSMKFYLSLYGHKVRSPSPFNAELP